MNIIAQKGQKIMPQFSVRAMLHFGTEQIRLPLMNVEGATLTTVANNFKAKSDCMSEMIAGAHLELIEIGRGCATEAESAAEPTALDKLGRMVANSLMGWLQK